ncbi:M20 family metallopeptidase [Mesorhizobium sp. ZMM04-5]|uniref:M20 family metallopeptidase n=1 Tax=Mesorhizobium marinum TaxID=3228790 RepID=A0ABV3QUU5_9HYPH
MIGDEAWITGALAELVSTPSLSGNESAAQEIVKRLMREAGANDVRAVPVDAARLEERYGFRTPTPTQGMFALVGSWGDPATRPFVVLNGHVDTVPATAGWEIDPYEPRIAEGWMNGLGSADMKAGVVGAIAAVARARAAGRLRGYVEIHSVPDEEDGGGTGTLACVDDMLSGGRIPDFAIVCEPTSVEIATAQVGSRAMHFTFGGAQSHANMKPSGASAVEAAIDLAMRLGQWAEMPHRLIHPLLGATSVNIGRIHGGIGATSVAPDCEMEVCFTYHPNDEDALIAEIDAIVEEWREHQPPAITMEFRELHNVHPFATDPDLGPVRELARALGRDAVHPRGFPAGSDGRLISRNLKCPTVIFGPGDFNRIHKINEAVRLTEIVAHAETLENFLSTGH